MGKTSRLLLWLIVPVVLCALVIAAVLFANRPFSKHERSIIERSDSLMYVTVLPKDSTVLRALSVDMTAGELRSPQLRTLMAKMLYTVQDPSQDGVGIAAPQVGINKRLVCVQRFDKPGEPFECYPNIHIDSLLGPLVPGREGCLSVPGKWGIVRRSSSVVISYVNLDTMRPVSERVDGFTAVIFQHECDHLDGVLYIDKADSLFCD